MAVKNNTKPLAEIVQKSLAKITKNAELVSDAEEMEVSRKEIEDRAAAMGYMARCMTLATIPHSRLPDDTIVYERRNGDYTLSLRADPKYGLPFGVIPRLLMSWVSVEAVRTQSPQLRAYPRIAKKGFNGLYLRWVMKDEKLSIVDNIG
jgi:hypothetical protein